MYHSLRATFVVLLFLSAASLAQIDVYYPSNTPGSGAPQNDVFGVAALGAPIGVTLAMRYPASQLTSAGLVTGSVLKDIAFTPDDSVTMTIPVFQACAALAYPSWGRMVFQPNLVNAVDFYDSNVLGPLTWTVQANAWNVLNPAPVGLVWDGVSDIAIYMTMFGGMSAGSGTMTPGDAEIAAFRSADGLVERNITPSWSATIAQSNDFSGLRARLTFLPPPPTQPGTVTFLPVDTISQGGAVTVVFQAPSNAGETYIPFVSCTPGLTQIPNTAFSLPMAFDACTAFYFTHPYANQIFSLTPPGSFAGTLSPTGHATGILFTPATLVPSGLVLTLSIAFVTVNGPTITGAHGPGSITIL